MIASYALCANFTVSLHTTHTCTSHLHHMHISLTPHAHTHLHHMHILTYTTCTYSLTPHAHTHLHHMHILTYTTCTYSQPARNSGFVIRATCFNPCDFALKGCTDFAFFDRWDPEFIFNFVNATFPTVSYSSTFLCMDWCIAICCSYSISI